MRRFTGNVLLLGIALVLAISVGASAGTVSYTQSLSKDDTILDWLNTIELPKFDTSAGYQLIGVTLDMESDFTLTAGLENLANKESTMSYILDVKRELAFGTTSYISNTKNYSESGIDVTARDGVTDFAGTAGWNNTYDTETIVSTSALLTAPADLANFTRTVNSDKISLDVSATTVSWLPKGTAGSKAAFYYAEMPTIVRVTYQFIPEPAGIIAICTGLISLLGIILKRRALNLYYSSDSCFGILMPKYAAHHE
ncbi:MAG: choice-of-anchor E domain-containing protein [Armatimonadetes bacterium]|nr:choice-of-anchor E domain-containing protein [Armatimonadota bacterium]